MENQFFDASKDQTNNVVNNRTKRVGVDADCAITQTFDPLGAVQAIAIGDHIPLVFTCGRAVARIGPMPLRYLQVSPALLDPARLLR